MDVKLKVDACIDRYSLLTINCPVSSKKRINTLSSTEAELVAANEYLQNDALLMRYLLDFTPKIPRPSITVNTVINNNPSTFSSRGVSILQFIVNIEKGAGAHTDNF